MMLPCPHLRAARKPRRIQNAQRLGFGAKTWRNSSRGSDESGGAGVYAVHNSSFAALTVAYSRARSAGDLPRHFQWRVPFTMAGVVQQRSLVNALYSAAAFGLTSWRCAKSPNLLTLLPMQVRAVYSTVPNSCVSLKRCVQCILRYSCFCNSWYSVELLCLNKSPP
jgi:hypothetical protein